MIAVLPQPTREEAEMFATFGADKTWQTLEGYLKRCFDVVVATLGDPNSRHEEDQVSKGMKLMIEEMAKLPKISKELLGPSTQEEESVNLDERSSRVKTKGGNK
jgi:hypothetical protein